MNGSLIQRAARRLRLTPGPPRVRTDREIAAIAFDAAFYLRTNADVAANGGDPLDHFMAFGWREGRDPASDFSVRAYLEAFPEVAEAGVNPFVHYLASGRPRVLAGEPALGFRHSIIEQLVPMQDRVARARETVTPTLPRDVLDRALATSRSSLRRLHVTFSHDDFTAHLGGLQLALRREAARLADLGRDHLHLHPVGPWQVVRTADDPAPLGVVWNGVALGAFAPADIAAVLAFAGDAETRSFAIHSLLGHAADETADILDALGLRAGVFWLHDFASVCAGFHLLRNDVEDCGAPPAGSAACRICLYGPWRARHADEHARLFERLDLTVAAPSQVTLDHWLAVSGLRPAATEVLPHATLQSPRPASSKAGPLRVAFVGFPAPHKGWPIFRGLSNRLAGDQRYKFLHLGGGSDPMAAAAFIEVSVSANQPNAMRDALAAAEVDVVLVWSLCRETFSYVAYEAVAAGCAVLTGPDSGNVAAFVAASGAGRVLPDEAALHAAFDGGEVLALSRDRRRPMAYDLAFSALTLDLAARPTA